MAEPKAPFLPPAASLTKTQILNYRVTNPLGRNGSCFETYQATSLEMTQHYCLKFLITNTLDNAPIAVSPATHATHFTSQTAITMLEKEAKIINHLHKGYPPISGNVDLSLTVGEVQVEEVQGIGMLLRTQLKPGPTLAQYISDLAKEGLGPKSFSKIRSKVLGLAAALTEALVFLHSKKITHGNIRPENVILTKNKICLCGYSKAQQHSDRIDQEKVQADIKMVAECIYSCITGFLPDSGKVYCDWFRKIERLGSFYSRTQGYNSSHLGSILLPIGKSETAFAHFLSKCFDGEFDNALQMKMTLDPFLAGIDVTASLAGGTIRLEQVSIPPLKGLFARFQGVSLSTFKQLLTRIRTTFESILDEGLIKNGYLIGIYLDPKITDQGTKDQRIKIFLKFMSLVMISLGQAWYIARHSYAAMQNGYRLSCWADVIATTGSQAAFIKKEFDEIQQYFNDRIDFIWKNFLGADPPRYEQIWKYCKNPFGLHNYATFTTIFKINFQENLSQAKWLVTEYRRFPECSQIIEQLINLSALMLELEHIVDLHDHLAIDDLFESYGVFKSPSCERKPEVLTAIGFAAANMLSTKISRNLI